MQKLLPLFLSILLILSVGTMALAETDFGLNQDYAGTSYLRLDTEVFAFQVPFRNKLKQFKLGAKIPVGFYDLYGVGYINASYDGNNRYSFDPIDIGLGYPLRMGDFPLTIRSELLMTSPVWSDTSSYEIKPYLGLQFRFSGLGGE